MYRFVWRHLPGPTPVRVLLAALLLLGTLAVLFLVAFPALEPHLPFEDIAIGG